MSFINKKYVDFVNGSDIDGDGSKENPYQTVTHASWKRRGGGFNNTVYTTGYAMISNAASLQLTDDLKVECTIYDFKYLDCSLVAKWRDIDGNRSWRLLLTSDKKIRAVISGDGNTVALDYTGTTVVRWADTVSFTFESGVLKLFINGVKETVVKNIDTGTPTIFNSTENIYLGHYFGSSEDYFVGIMNDVIITDLNTSNQVCNLEFATPYKTDSSNVNEIKDISGNNNNASIYDGGSPATGAKKDAYDPKGSFNEVDMKIDFGNGDTLKPTGNIDISFGIEDITQGDIIGKWGVDKGYQLSCYQGQLVVTLSSDNETVTYKAVSINSLPNGSDSGVVVRFVLYNGRPTVYFDDVLQNFDIVLDLNINSVSETTRSMIAGDNDEFYEAELDILNGGLINNITAGQADQFSAGYTPTFTRASVRTVYGFYEDDTSSAELKLILLANNIAPMHGARYNVSDSATEATESYRTYADGSLIPVDVYNYERFKGYENPDYTGYAVDFLASASEYIQIPYHSSLLTANDFTVIFNCDNFISISESTVIGQYNYLANKRQFKVGFLNGNLKLWTSSNGTSLDIIETTDTFNDGNHHKFKITVSGTSAVFEEYVNNAWEELNTTGMVGTILQSDSDTFIGSTNGGVHFFKGSLWGIEYINNSTGQYAGYWPLEESSGATAYNVSENGNHGTLNTTTGSIAIMRLGRTGVDSIYNIGSGYTNVNDVYIPALFGSKTEDVLGNPLEYFPEYTTKTLVSEGVYKGYNPNKTSVNKAYGILLEDSTATGDFTDVNGMLITSTTTNGKYRLASNLSSGNTTRTKTIKLKAGNSTRAYLYLGTNASATIVSTDADDALTVTPDTAYRGLIIDNIPSDRWATIKVIVNYDDIANNRFWIAQNASTLNNSVIGSSVQFKYPQDEDGYISTSYIPTSGSPFTRIDDDLYYDGSVINDTNGAIEIDLNLRSIPATGEFYTIIGADASYILKVDDSGDIVFNDGTTESSSGLTMSEGTSRIWLTWSGSIANVYLDGVKSADLSYDETLAPTNMYIGSDSTGNQADALFENVKVYNTVVSQEFIVKDN